MQQRHIKVLKSALFLMLTSCLMYSAAAEEIVIQQEKISFEKCLKVITESRDKLSLVPTITHSSTQKRVAVFTLADGNLTITCDAEEGNVTVSTNSD